MARKKRSAKQKARSKKTRSVRVKQPTISWWRTPKILFPAIAILIVTCLVFYPSLQNAFVNWDDDRNFYENPWIVELNRDNFLATLKVIFSSHVIGNYNPLTIATFAIEKMAFGLDQPFYWHLNNLLLHLICVLLAYRLALLLGLRQAGAILLAILFAIHPMRVESVAWVTERKDVLYGAFYLAALIYYVKWRQRPSMRLLVLIYICFILSLFSKIQAVALPLSMLAIDYLFDGRWTVKSVLRKWPYFLLSLIFGLIGVYFLGQEGSLESNATYAWFGRIFVGTYSFLVYIVKAVFPYRLSPLYPYPNAIPWFFYASSLAVPIYAFVIYKAWRNQWRHFLFGFLFFVINIVFLLQVLGAGQGFIADRFTYIAYFGLFFIIGYYFQHFYDRFPQKRILMSVVLALYVGYLGYVSWKQCHIWKNGGTLWTHVLKYYDNVTLPFGNRANFYRDSGQWKKALDDYSATIRLKPNDAAPYNSRARLYFNSQNVDTLLLSLQDYNRAIELDGNNAEYLTNRAAVQARLNRIDEALNDLNRAIVLDPNHVNAYLNRSVIYNGQRNYQKALDDVQRYLAKKPYTPDMLYESARLKRLLNRTHEALDDLNAAIRYNPNQGIYYYERSIDYFQLGRMQESKNDLLRAQQMGVQVDPAYAARVLQQ